MKVISLQSRGNGTMFVVDDGRCRLGILTDLGHRFNDLEAVIHVHSVSRQFNNNATCPKKPSEKGVQRRIDHEPEFLA